MFQNQFQNTPLFEIFDSKDVLNKANKEKEKHYQQLLKITTNSFVKDFDKQLKNYVIELQGQNTKVNFPKEGDLGLVQQFLCLQIYVPQTQQWTIEFSITDITLIIILIDYFQLFNWKDLKSFTKRTFQFQKYLELQLTQIVNMYLIKFQLIFKSLFFQQIN